MSHTLTVALISDVFHTPGSSGRLRARLREARARGAELALLPEIVANAMTSCTYALSVNRPAPEQGVPLGGPSCAVAPDGEVLVETIDPVALVTLDRAVVAQARKRYPGYLKVEAGLYAAAWKSLA